MTTTQKPQPSQQSDEIIAYDKGQKFTPAPEGQYASVCCDIVDLGMVESSYQGKVTKKQKIRVVFQVSETNPENGKPFLVSQWFTLSMNEKANLRAFLEQWRGKPYTEDEIKAGVPVTKMLGVGAFIQIVHNERQGKVYANISTIMRLPKGYKAPEIDPTYVRVKDRPVEDGAGPGAPGQQQRPVDDEAEEDDDFPL